MYLCCRVNYQVFSAKILQHMKRSVLIISMSCEHFRIYHAKHLILLVCHYKSTNATNCEIYVVNGVTFLVEEG